jgi:hypothetical protein
MANPIEAENSADQASGDHLLITKLEFPAGLAIGLPLNARLDDRILVVADGPAEVTSFDIGKEWREGAADVERSTTHDLVKLQTATCKSADSDESRVKSTPQMAQKAKHFKCPKIEKHPNNSRSSHFHFESHHKLKTADQTLLGYSKHSAVFPLPVLSDSEMRAVR